MAKWLLAKHSTEHVKMPTLIVAVEVTTERGTLLVLWAFEECTDCGPCVLKHAISMWLVEGFARAEHTRGEVKGRGVYTVQPYELIGCTVCIMTSCEVMRLEHCTRALKDRVEFVFCHIDCLSAIAAQKKAMAIITQKVMSVTASILFS